MYIVPYNNGENMAINFDNVVPLSVHYLSVRAINLWKKIPLKTSLKSSYGEKIEKTLYDIIYSEPSLFREVSRNPRSLKINDFPATAFSRRVVGEIVKNNPEGISLLEQAIISQKIAPHVILEETFEAHGILPKSLNITVGQFSKAIENIISNPRYHSEKNGYLRHFVEIGIWHNKIKAMRDSLRSPAKISSYIGNTDLSKITRGLAFTAFGFSDEYNAKNFVRKYEKQIRKEMIEVLGSAHPNKIIREKTLVDSIYFSDGLRKYEWMEGSDSPRFDDFMSNDNPYIETSTAGIRREVRYTSDSDFICSINLSKPGGDDELQYQKWNNDSYGAGMDEKYLPHSNDSKARYVASSKNPFDLMEMMGERHLTEDFYERLIELNPSLIDIIDQKSITRDMVLRLSARKDINHENIFAAINDNSVISGAAIECLILLKKDGINCFSESLITTGNILTYFSSYGELPEMHREGIGKVYEAINIMNKDPSKFFDTDEKKSYCTSIQRSLARVSEEADGKSEEEIISRLVNESSNVVERAVLCSLLRLDIETHSKRMILNCSDEQTSIKRIASGFSGIKEGPIEPVIIPMKTGKYDRSSASPEM